MRTQAPDLDRRAAWVKGVVESMLDGRKIGRVSASTLRRLLTNGLHRLINAEVLAYAEEAQLLRERLDQFKGAIDETLAGERAKMRTEVARIRAENGGLLEAASRELLNQHVAVAKESARVSGQLAELAGHLVMVGTPRWTSFLKWWRWRWWWLS